MVLNRQHSILAKYDYEISDSGSADSASDKCQEFLDALKLDEGDMRRMAMHVQDVRHINGQIRMLEGMISKETLQNEDAIWSGPRSWRPIFATFYSHLSPPISGMTPSESCIYCPANSEGVMYFRAEWILRWL